MDDEPLADKSGARAPDGTMSLETVLANVTFHGVAADPNPPQFTLGALQGPPGPMPDLSDLPIPGTVPEAVISFVVEGWEYRFPSSHHARVVRERLMKMTLEGEL